MIQGRAYWKSWDFDGPGKLGRGNVGNYTRRDSLNETVFNGRAIAMGISGRGSEQMTAWPRVRVNFASLLLTNKNLQIPECNRTILSFFLSPNSSPYACPRLFPRHRISQQTQSYFTSTSSTQCNASNGEH